MQKGEIKIASSSSFALRTSFARVVLCGKSYYNKLICNTFVTDPVVSVSGVRACLSGSSEGFSIPGW